MTDLTEPHAIRKLGNYERYSLARDTTGNPQLITYVSTYSALSDLPTADTLRARARQLVREYPLLRARVVDGRTTSPKWGLLTDEQVDQALLEVITDVDLVDLVGHPAAGSGEVKDRTDSSGLSATLETVISHELGNDKRLRVTSHGFLWQITRYRSPANRSPAFLALTLNHVISDGKSGLALFNALLTEAESTQKGSFDSPSPAEIFPRALETTIDCRPGYRFMLGVIWNELVVPQLPDFIAKRVKQTACWPGVPRQKGAVDQKIYKHFSLGPLVVAKLKALGKRNQVNTLHPIFEIAAVVALWSLVVDLEQSSPLQVTHDTPVSLRDPSLSHPPISGNYAAGIEARISCSPHGEQLFWQEARKYAEWLLSGEGKQQAIQTTGMLVHIPDQQNEVGSDSPVPTGWETFLVNKASRAPGSSLEVSNLGYLGQLPPFATNVAFAQTPHIFGAPFFVNAVGHQGGVDFVVCWRKGAFVLDNGKTMEGFASAFEVVLRHLAEQEDDHQSMENGNALSFADIRKAVDDKRPLPQ